MYSYCSGAIIRGDSLPHFFSCFCLQTTDFSQSFGNRCLFIVLLFHDEKSGEDLESGSAATDDLSVSESDGLL